MNSPSASLVHSNMNITSAAPVSYPGTATVGYSATVPTVGYSASTYPVSNAYSVSNAYPVTNGALTAYHGGRGRVRQVVTNKVSHVLQEVVTPVIEEVYDFEPEMAVAIAPQFQTQYQPPPPPQRMELHITENRQDESHLESLMQILRKQIVEAESREARLRRQIDELSVKVRVSSQKESQISITQQEISKVQEQLFEAELRLLTADGHRGAAVGEVAKIELRLREADERSRKCQVYSQDIEATTARLEEALARLRAVEGERDILQQSIISLEIRINETTDSVRQVRGSFDGDRGRFQEQLAILQQRLLAAEKDRDDLEREIGFFNVKIQEVQTNIKNSKQQAGQAQHVALEEQQQLEAQIVNLQLQITIVQEEIVEARREASFWEVRFHEVDGHLINANKRIAELEALIQRLEIELRNLRSRLESKVDLKSSTHVKETYKVKTFELAAKLAIMDGTDDGMFNGLPIEVEGEGLYKELVAAGRRPNAQAMATKLTSGITSSSATTSGARVISGNTSGSTIVSGGSGYQTSSTTTGGSTSGTVGGATTTSGSGAYQTVGASGSGSVIRPASSGGIVSGSAGAYQTSGGSGYQTVGGATASNSGAYRTIGGTTAVGSSASGASGASSYVTPSGGATTAGSASGAAYRTVGGVSSASGAGSVSTSKGETYIAETMDIAASLSQMGANDDGTYKGLPIEVKGRGLYRDLRSKK